MSVSLIIPAAGQSSRFPGTRPKWLLTHPLGAPMARAAIAGLRGDVSDIYLVVLEEHLIEHTDFEHLYAAFRSSIQFDGVFHLVVLDRPTRTQAETVYRAIQSHGIEGAIFVKDVDNYFECEVPAGNAVCTVDVSSMELDSPGAKSYVEINPLTLYVKRIAERRIISSEMSCGGYSFADAADFVAGYEGIVDALGAPPGYMSDVVQSLIDFGVKFETRLVGAYEDWGTLRAWVRYVNTFATFFVDVDGTLLKSSGRFVRPFHGETGALERNVAALQRLHATGRVRIILTTARSRFLQLQTYKELDDAGVPYDEVIFGLPHARRVIVNDHSTTNPYPSAEAINLTRDADNLLAALGRWLPA